MNNEILEPVICMAILTFFMMIWMYATRIPASKTLEDQGVNLEDLSHPSLSLIHISEPTRPY